MSRLLAPVADRPASPGHCGPSCRATWGWRRGRGNVLDRQRWEEGLRAGDIDMSGLCLGVDIGGTKTRVGLVTSAHQVLDVRESPTPVRDGAQAVLEVVARLG